MKQFYLAFVFSFVSIFAYSQEPFITTWEVTAGDLDITIPTTGTGYDYSIDFGDSTVQSNVTGSISHSYSQPGTYTVSITGDFPRIYFFGSSFNNKILSVEQWGDIQWQSMERAFYNCQNLVVNATDAPDLSQVSDLSSMFAYCNSFNQPINHWDVSIITNMSGMFYSVGTFNQPLNNWDVSNVTNFSNMFTYASSFNQDITNWQINTGNLSAFLNNSGFDVNNYDNFLTHLAALSIADGYLGGDGLVYCNHVARDYLINVLGWNIYDNGLSSECNAIIGDIFFDENNNGCDLDDIGVHGFMINANDGFFDFTTYSSDGTYYLPIAGTSFTVSVVNIPSYFTVSPENATVTFSSSNTEELDFCLTANQTVNDLNITILAIGEARPGFEADYQLVVRNVGTETINNVSATLNFDAAMQTFVIALPGPNSTTGSSLSFELGTVQPFETRYIDIIMQTFPPPTVEGGDILNFTATVTPETGDYTPDDNTYTLEQIVVNSFDPNDKQVMQGAEVHIDDVDQYLDYLIRFQNTGTASAINVRILDTLHPKLDWGTLIPISASHDYVVQITDGNRVEFMFDNIHLPDSLSNEPESHGFVAYKIKPKNDVQVGDVISGDAGIYFDFNPPIITNMVFTEIVENLDVTDILDPANQIVVYPNPTSKLLHLYIPEGIQIEGATIYDLQGKNVQQLQGTETVLDVEKLSPGLYFLEITTNEGTINRRFVKR